MIYRVVDDSRFEHPVFVPRELDEIRLLYESRQAEKAMAALEEQAAALPSARAVMATLYLTGNLELPINRERAAELCLGDAKAGYPYAQYILAWVSAEQGHPVQAANWMRQAAQAGFPPAMYDMGRFYLNGIGVAKDRSLGVSWFRRATKTGHLIALRGLLQQYRAGWFGNLRKLVASILWPLSGPALYLYWRLNGPNTDKYFFYDWPNVGRKK